MELVAQAEHLFGHVEHAVGNMDAARDRFARSIDRFRALAIPWGTGQCAERDGGGWPLRPATPARPNACSMRPHRCFETPARGSCPGRCMFAPSWRCGAGTRIEAIALVRESLTRIRKLHDKFAFVYALVPLAAAAVLKGDDAWAARILGARDAVTERTGVTVVDKSVQDLRDRRNGRHAHASARIGGPGVRGGTHELHRCAAEGHRGRRSREESSSANSSVDREDRSRGRS